MKTISFRNKSQSVPWVVVSIFLALFFIVLNPYSIYGKPGQAIGILLAVYSIWHGVSKPLWRRMLLPMCVMFYISIIGVVSSVLHGITQFSHALSVISLIVTTLAAHGLSVICRRNNISVDRLILMLFFVILANSLIILLELSFKDFRIKIESFLDPLTTGSINYADGFRLRGFASAGGANLSLTVPAAVIMGVYLLNKKVMSKLFFVSSVTILIVSTTVIGRTGLVLLVIPVIGYLAFGMRRINTSSVVELSVVGLLFTVCFYLFYDNVTGFLAEKFGENFLNYSFKFLFEGESGLKNEGTVGMVGKFLTVVPTELSESLFGFGFYGGSNFSPWTDSGYSRMFLSVGYIFGIIFYVFIFKIYFSGRNFDSFLVYSFIALLAIAEAKEPLLFSGYSSRMFLIILVFVTLEKNKNLFIAPKENYREN